MVNIDDIRDGFRRYVESVEREAACYEKSIALRDEEIKRLRTETDRMRTVLADEDREALRWLRDCISVRAQFPMFNLQSDENRRAIAALDKVLGRESL